MSQGECWIVLRLALRLLLFSPSSSPLDFFWLVWHFFLKSVAFCIYFWPDSWLLQCSLLPSSSHSSLFWASWVALLFFVSLSSSVSLTMFVSWRPYLAFDIHMLCAAILSLSLGMWFASLLITKSLWFRACSNPLFPSSALSISVCCLDS